MTLKRNKPTALGYEFGAHMARFADHAEQSYQGSNLAVPHRCNTCAFRKGTYANGCEPTLWDAFNTIMNKDGQFLCHEHTKSQEPPVCAGWMLLHGKKSDSNEYSDNGEKNG